jgi:tetratricopeptide (TPR) repeat protein
VRHLIERGELSRPDGGDWIAAPQAGATLPDSLQALLTARIDRLDEATRRTLQVASVIGRSFSRSPLAALVDDPDALDGHLVELQRMELVREVSRVPEPGYAFNHSLTHEAVYNTILLRQRRAMHRRVAEVIETLRAGDLATVAPILAHHYMEADEPERALPHLQTAADAALRLHATAEAITLYDRALPIALAGNTPSDHLATLYTLRGRALELQSRFAEANESYEELERLAIARADPLLELEAVLAQGKLHATVTPLYNPVRGRTLMERALRLAEATGNRAAEVRILWNLVNIDRFDLNSLENAVANGEKGVTMARELGLAEELAYLLNDLSDVYGTFGRIDVARSTIDEARAAWRALGNEPMLADSLTNSAMWEMMAGNLRQALAFAEEANEIASRLGNIWGEAYSLGMRGQTLASLGEYGRAMADLTAAIEKARAAGFVGGLMICGAFLSRVLLDTNRPAEALEQAREALNVGRERLPQFAGMCVGRMVMALIALGDIKAAAETLDNPLMTQERIQIFALYDVTIGKIELALVTGRSDEALRIANDSIQHLSDIGCLLWLPDMRYAAVRALIALGRTDEAAELLYEAVALGRTVELRGSLWRYLGTWAALEEARGNHDAANALRAEAAAEIDFVAANTWPDDLRAAFLAQTK